MRPGGRWARHFRGLNSFLIHGDPWESHCRGPNFLENYSFGLSFAHEETEAYRGHLSSQ